jgi:hypothetical protein
MGSIASRITAMRTRRRDKRVERLGGYPAWQPEVAVEIFSPELGQAARVENVVRGVARLGPDGVDEGTAYPLDNLLNAQGDEWQSRLSQQYRSFQSAAEDRLRHLQGIVQQQRHLYEVDLRRLHDAEVAVESAMLALSGEHFAPPAGSGQGTAGAPEGNGRSSSTAPPSTAWVPAGDGERDPLDGPAALLPPRVSRSEIRRIFEPRDANRVSHWAEPGFRDPTLLGGRPRGTYLHLLALLLAAGADIGAFVQVVELVLSTQSNATIYLVVAGLTAVVLYIAHMVGVLFREAKAAGPSPVGSRRWRRSWRRTLVAVVCILAWGALGFLAFYIRTTVPLPVAAQIGGGQGAVIGGGATAAGSGTTLYSQQSAFLFLGLYVATGIVAALGAYFTHNPHRGQYVAALRAYRKAAERAAATANQFGRVEAGYLRQRAELENSHHILAQSQQLDRAFTEQLKQSVRLQIATMAKDPAVTDALFEEDHKPYWNT